MIFMFMERMKALVAFKRQLLCCVFWGIWGEVYFTVYIY